jgi:hypothetical protein
MARRVGGRRPFREAGRAAGSLAVTYRSVCDNLPTRLSSKPNVPDYRGSVAPAGIGDSAWTRGARPVPKGKPGTRASVVARMSYWGHGKKAPARRSLSASIVHRSSIELFFTARASALLLPTRMTSRLPRVTPVYSKFRWSMR